MNKAPSPYTIETGSGTIELTKGAYLTMLKRKSSVNKTLIKSKPISHYSNLKQTVKTKMIKSLKAGGRNSIRNSLRRSLRDSIAMKDNLNKSHSFAICNDQ